MVYSLLPAHSMQDRKAVSMPMGALVSPDTPLTPRWYLLIQLPRTTVMNYHKFGRLTTQKFILSQFWELEV